MAGLLWGSRYRRSGRRRRLAMGLSTLLGAKPRGFFIPYRYADRVKTGGYPALGARFAARAGAFLDLLAEIEAWIPQFLTMRGPAPAPRFDQDWFARLDAAAAYAIVRRTRPHRIVEVGSGHSTRFLARAIADGGLRTSLLCIDPAPRASLQNLAVEWLPHLLQDVPQACFTDLRPGDVLFIDSSHVLMPGSDVDRLLNHVLPVLAPGTLVHLHDIFLPDPYPEGWAWRGYNEQSAVAALLQGDAYEVVFASHYLVSRHADRLARSALATLPRPAGALECSLWLRKRGASAD
ncbi:MAG TPA: class I SAM-dependent methyltransferase [Geminicoccaceae bacterium]|nr:class I SAM-dependent methyltransferase [Geminicoccaceae bacterium]